jgi:hypothetical protein
MLLPDLNLGQVVGRIVLARCVIAHAVSTTHIEIT